LSCFALAEIKLTKHSIITGTKNDEALKIVHGHTISREVEERTNRIGIDTGAYRTGVLTALAIEGRDRWLIDTAPDSRNETAPRN
jgi:hypothetical protein